MRLALFLLVLTALCVALGRRLAALWRGEAGLLVALEERLYRHVGLDPSEEMSWGRYIASMLAFSLAVIVIVSALRQLGAPLLAAGLRALLSAAVGLTTLAALLRGRRASFWVDLTRATTRVLVPLAVSLAILLVFQGVAGMQGGAVSLAIPGALCFAWGELSGERGPAAALYGAMVLLLLPYVTR